MTSRSTDSLRYEKADNMLQLALEMQASRGGLSLQDIEERFGIGRRTAMRMRDAIMRNFPQAEEVLTDERIKRWRIPSGVMNQLVNFSADELADLNTAIRLLRQRNRQDQAANLETLAAKVKALMNPDAQRRVEPDLEALLEAEGLAMRPGPRPRIKVMVTEDLRRAIKGCNQVKIKYRNRKNRKLNTRLVYPYGFLHGHRHYLVAWHVHPKANDFTLFSLPNIEGVDVLDDCFERDENFSLQKFAERSFGLFQEEPFDVVWRFSAHAAKDAKDFLFHPTQTFKQNKDGTLDVHFHAGSDLEMAWHLYKWGDQVDVLEPKSLVKMIGRKKPKWPGLP